MEYSHILGVDLTKIDHYLGLNLDDAGFQEWVEGPGNLEVLCIPCHRGRSGVHSLPGPQRDADMFAKGAPPVVALSNSEIPVMPDPTPAPIVTVTVSSGGPIPDQTIVVAPKEK